MSVLAQLQQDINDAVDSYAVDMSETSKGGGGSRLYPAGYAMARLVQYVEFGMQPQEYQGAAKAPALEFRMGFAIWGDTKPFGDAGQPNSVPPANRPQDLFHNPDGTPGIIRTWYMKLGNNEKAGAKKAFDKMNYKGNAKHFAQFLGQPFLVKIGIKPAVGDKPARNTLELADTLPPFDQVSRQPYPVPEAPDDLYQLFLWNKPTLAGWSSLKIEGTSDDGKSKNYLQDRIIAAVDFQGSPLEQLLRGAGATLPSPEQLAPAAPAAPAPAVPATPVAPAVSLPVPSAVSPLPAAGVVQTPVATVNVADVPAVTAVPSMYIPAVPVQ